MAAPDSPEPDALRDSDYASTQLQPQSTCLVEKSPEDFPCTSGHIYRDDRVVDMAYEAENHVLGPMPLREFLEEFMPLPKERTEDYVSADKRKRFKKAIVRMKLCKKEKDLYPAFIKAVKPLCPNFPAHDTHDTRFPDLGDFTIKPDVCFYDKKWVKLGRRGISSVEMMAEFKISLNDDAFIDDDGRVPADAKYNMYNVPKYKECNRKEDETTMHEPSILLETDFEREEGDEVEEEEEYETQIEEEEEEEEIVEDLVSFETDIIKLTGQGRDTLGQITSYATAQKSAQFRTYFFSMLVFKQDARLLYWDNAGVVVTERFHLTNGFFAEFLERYNEADAERRGYDTTALLLTEAEINVVRNANVFEENERLIKLSTKPASDFSENHNFYVAKQVTYMGGRLPFGRSTRGFIAYSFLELKRKKEYAVKVFLKDTWRVLGRPQEHTFYERLHEKEVPYIPSVLRWLDIKGQTTKTQQLYEQSFPWAQIPQKVPDNLRGFQHYRLVLKEIGQPLTEFSSTKELVMIVYQALQAHSAAYKHGEILHRDISVGNIMWRVDEEGNRSTLLIDWDMAKFIHDKSLSAQERTGTWQFMARRLLSDPTQSLTNTLQDDLESFLYVLTWVTFRYTKNALTPYHLYYHLYSIFDESYYCGGKLAGGARKVVPSWVLDQAEIENETLYSLLNSMRAAIEIRYIAEPKSESEDEIPRYPFKTHMTIDNYNMRQKYIETSDGIIDIFRDILNLGPWPDNDATKENPMVDPERPVPPRWTLKGVSELLKDIAVDFTPIAKRQRTE